MADTLRDKFFEAQASAALWDVAVSLKRGNALPLDANSVFKSMADVDTYRNGGGPAYPGQIIAIVGETETKICYLDQELNVQSVGIIPSGDGKTIEVSATGAISLLGAAGAEVGTLPMIEEVEENGAKVSKIVWKTLEQIGAGDGNDNTTYAFNFANDKITITPTHNGVVQDAIELDLSDYVTTEELNDAIAAIEFPEDTNTEYHLEYDSNAKEIKLVVGKNDGKMTIDATPFIKDGMLNNVDYDAEKKELVFQWNTDAGITEDRVPVDGLIDVYTAGNGLQLEANKFSIKLDAEGEGFLTVGKNGLKLAGVQEAINAALKAAKEYADGKEHKNTTYTLSGEGVTVTLTPSEGEAQPVTLDAYTTKQIDTKLGENFEANAQVNVIEEIKVNGQKVEPTEKSVNISVPTKTSELTNDKNFLTNVRVKEAIVDDEGKTVYTPKLVITNGEDENGAAVHTVKVIDDSALQADIKKVKDVADTAVQTVEIGNTAFTKNGAKATITKQALLDELGIKEHATKDEREIKLESGTNNGTLKLTVGETVTDNVAVKGLGSAAYKEEGAFAPAGDYKTKQTAVNNKVSKPAHVISSLAQNENGEIAYEVKELTPADIGAQPAGNYQAAGDYKTKQTVVADPTATKLEGTQLTYVDSISQDENGVISATKKQVDLKDVLGELTDIMNFRAAITPTDAGFNEDIKSITNPEKGDVILYGEYEYIYDGNAWYQFGDAAGILATAKKYTDDEIAKLHGVDDDTIKLKDNKAYVAKVSTDVLEQGETTLIFCAGTASTVI